MESKMDMDSLILVSVDDHVVEPPDVFEGRVPAKYAEEVPKFVVRDDGTTCWRYQGGENPNFGLNAVAGRPPEEYGLEPTSFDDIRAGTWNVHERVKDMSANGVLASLNFPSFPRFAGQLFSESANEDPSRALAVIKAYNDWHLEAWCGPYPERFIPLCIAPLWDPHLMAEEVARVAALGCHAITFSANPYDLGYPSLHSDHWDPFWAACEENESVVCMHIGSNSKIEVTAPDAPATVQITGSSVALFSCASDLVWSPIFRKFPGLRVAMSEGGIGWIPYFLERIDYVYRHHKAWIGADFGDDLPSDIFKRNIVTCFIDDSFGLEARSHLNLDMITWESDYPHSDSTWPRSPETLVQSLHGLSADDISRITHGNALKIFSFDPFRYRESADCTVSALRAESADHDISVHVRGHRAKATTMAALADLPIWLPQKDHPRV
jgi:predicted TIM-barrel fold metal-dependent hydrolase